MALPPGQARMALATNKTPLPPGQARMALQAALDRAKKKHPTTSSPGSKPPTLTAEQWAEQQAEAYIQAQVDAIREQQKVFEEEQQTNYQRRIDQAKAMAEYIQAQGFDSKIRDIFSKSGHDIASMAQGFAGDTRALASADAAQQLNMLSGTGQEGAVRDQGTNMGDVTYGVGGFIPGRSLGETGAAAAANAALQPAFTLQQGQEDAGAALADSNSQLSDFAQAIAKAKAGKFEFKQSLLQDRQKTMLSVQAQQLDTIKADRDFWMDKQKLYIALGKEKLAAQAGARADAAEQRYAYESQGRDATGELKPGYTYGPQGQVLPPGMKVDKQGHVVKIYAPKTPKAPSTSSTVPGTPAYKAAQVKAVGARRKDIAKSVKEAMDKTKVNTPNPGQHSAAVYAAVRKQLMAEYASLATTPAARRALRKLIVNLLRAWRPSFDKGTTTTGATTDVTNDLPGISP